MTAIDPRTGEVLALASNPTFDLSEYNEKYAELSADPRAPLMNRALSGTYPPGSTFKVGIATAALSEHIITPTDTVYCSGTYKYYSDYQPKCWNIWGHGDLDVVHAIGTSCNCFFFEMGRLLTIDNINKYCTLYGFGQPTGIELTDVENTGRARRPRLCPRSRSRMDRRPRYSHGDRSGLQHLQSASDLLLYVDDRQSRDALLGTSARLGA